MKLAASWFEKAADAGSAPAQYRLAALYEKGIGIGVDKAKARSLYTKAADAGNPRAMHNLAVLLADGDGHPDYAAAVGWFRKAAQYGVHDSQYNLAVLLTRGLGAPQSLVQAYQWFAVAAASGDVRRGQEARRGRAQAVGQRRGRRQGAGGGVPAEDPRSCRRGSRCSCRRVGWRGRSFSPKQRAFEDLVAVRKPFLDPQASLDLQVSLDRKPSCAPCSTPRSRRRSRRRPSRRCCRRRRGDAPSSSAPERHRRRWRGRWSGIGPVRSRGSW